ncbi:MAG TPA: hypothetical protein VFX70_11425 [Mycobacteriales bacterium]|nr:hypothetical protein [Mycobacteriales bacterium]
MAQVPREPTPNASPAHLFGAELRRRREERGWSLTQAILRFAESGRRVHHGYLGHVELGERLPEDRQFAELADEVFSTGGLLGRLWEFADADRWRTRRQAQQDRRDLINIMAGMLDPVVSGEIVLVPYLTGAGTVGYMRISRRTFVSTGGLAAAMFAAGAFTPDDLERLGGALDQPERTDLRVADHFRAMLAAHKANDFVQSPAARIGSVTAQTAELDRLCRDARDPVRPALRNVQAEYAEYTGWLHQEIGNHAPSVYWTSQAETWAQAGGDYQMVSFVHGRKINIAYWAEQYHHATELADTADRVPWHMPPGVASLTAQNHALACAALGDEAGTRGRLDAAAALLDRRAGSGEDTVYWAQRHTPDHLRERVAHCYVRLGHAEEAVDILREVMSDIHRPVSLLALAHARAGNPEAAIAAGNVSLNGIVSAPALTNLDATGRALSRWANLDAVRDFTRRVADTRRLLRQDARTAATTG